MPPSAPGVPASGAPLELPPLTELPALDPGLLVDALPEFVPPDPELPDVVALAPEPAEPDGALSVDAPSEVDPQPATAMTTASAWIRDIVGRMK